MGHNPRSAPGAAPSGLPAPRNHHKLPAIVTVRKRSQAALFQAKSEASAERTTKNAPTKLRRPANSTSKAAGVPPTTPVAKIEDKRNAVTSEKNPGREIAVSWKL